MSSNNLSLADCGSLDDSSELLSDKETQTSSAYITDSFDLVKGPSRPLPKGFDKSDIETTVNNILEYRVIEDHPTESISTDLVTESFVKNIINPNASIDEVSASPSSLKYCKEVIKPYLNPHEDNCENDDDSLENLIRDALEDLPDYQPCFENNEGNIDKQEKLNGNITIIKMGTIPNANNEKEKTEVSNLTAEKISEIKVNISELKSPATTINITKETNAEEVQLPENDQNESKEFNRSASAESVTECVKESRSAIEKSASSCVTKIDHTIGITSPENSNEKPKYYAMEKPKVDVSHSHNVETETGNSLNSLKNLLNNPTEKITMFKDACRNFAENLMNNPNEQISAIKETCKDLAENLLNNPDEKMNTIKETCKDYADKLYKTSRDALNLLASESAKRLTTSHTELSGNDNSHENQKVRLTVDSVTRFLFQKAENTPIKDDDKEKDPQTEDTTGTSKITGVIPSAVKLGFSKIQDDIVSSHFEKSSPYDKPLLSNKEINRELKEVANKTPDPPETKMPTVSAIDHTPEPPSPSNVFAIIRSKIFSIFRDETETSLENEGNEDDEEEDPFERFMEQ